MHYYLALSSMTEYYPLEKSENCAKYFFDKVEDTTKILCNLQKLQVAVYVWTRLKEAMIYKEEHIKGKVQVERGLYLP